MDVVSMTLGPNVPSLSVPGLVGGVVLLALSAGYVLRRRF